jgi:hypothetical protein
MKSRAIACGASLTLWAIVAITSGGYETKYLAIAVGLAIGAAVVRDRRASGAAEGRLAVALAIVTLVLARAAAIPANGSDSFALAHTTVAGYVAYATAAVAAWAASATRLSAIALRPSASRALRSSRGCAPSSARTRLR